MTTEMPTRQHVAKPEKTTEMPRSPSGGNEGVRHVLTQRRRACEREQWRRRRRRQQEHQQSGRHSRVLILGHERHRHQEDRQGQQATTTATTIGDEEQREAPANLKPAKLSQSTFPDSHSRPGGYAEVQYSPKETPSQSQPLSTNDYVLIVSL